MNRKSFLLLALLFHAGNTAFSQQYGLFDTHTLFDTFENPAQSAFARDSSRRFASNFLLPSFGLKGEYKGEAGDLLYKLIHDRQYETSAIKDGVPTRNQLLFRFNQYLLNFRIFISPNYQRELGLSWQFRSQTNVNFTNESLISV